MTHLPVFPEAAVHFSRLTTVRVVPVLLPPCTSVQVLVAEAWVPASARPRVQEALRAVADSTSQVRGWQGQGTGAGEGKRVVGLQVCTVRRVVGTLAADCAQMPPTFRACRRRHCALSWLCIACQQHGLYLDWYMEALHVFHASCGVVLVCAHGRVLVPPNSVAILALPPPPCTAPRSAPSCSR